MRENDMPLSVLDAVLIDGKIWCFDNLLQALCCIDSETYQLEVQCTYNDERGFAASAIFYKNQRIYLFSHKGLHVLVYDFMDNIFKKIDMPAEQMEDEIIARVVIYENELVILPSSLSICNGKIAAFSFDIGTGSFSKIDLWAEDAELKGEEIWISYPSVMDNLVTAMDWENGYVVVIDIEHKSYRYMEIGVYGTDACRDNKGRIWVKTWNKSDITVVDTKGKLQRILPYRKQKKELYSVFADVEKYILILPRYNDDVVFIDKEDIGIHRIPIKEKRTGDGSKSVAFVQKDKRIWIMPNTMRHIVEIDMENWAYKKVKLWCDDRSMNRIAYRNPHVIHYEDGANYSLRTFLDYIRA